MKQYCPQNGNYQGSICLTHRPKLLHWNNIYFQTPQNHVPIIFPQLLRGRIYLLQGLYCNCECSHVKSEKKSIFVPTTWLILSRKTCPTGAIIALSKFCQLNAAENKLQVAWNQLLKFPIAIHDHIVTRVWIGADEYRSEYQANQSAP